MRSLVYLGPSALYYYIKYLWVFTYIVISVLNFSGYSTRVFNLHNNKLVYIPRQLTVFSFYVFLII